MIEQTLSIIKPDAIERNLEGKIKNLYKRNNLKILKTKKVKFQKKKLQNFIKYIKRNHFMKIYVITYLLDL